MTVMDVEVAPLVFTYRGGDGTMENIYYNNWHSSPSFLYLIMFESLYNICLVKIQVIDFLLQIRFVYRIVL